MLSLLFQSTESNGVGPVFRPKSGKAAAVPLLPEVEVYLHLLVLISLIDRKQYAEVRFMIASTSYPKRLLTYPPPTLAKNFLPTNRMHWSDLKRCMIKCHCFRCHFKVNILTRFGIFCRFGSLYTYNPYNGYNKFYLLTLVLCSNWTCRIWFGILSSRAVRIVVSDFAYLLPFSNNFPLKYLKNIHSGFTLGQIPNNSARSIYMGLWLKLL